MTERLTIVCGNAGTGKSTLGRQLAAKHSALLLDSDTVSERLVRIGLRGYGLHEDDRDSARYKELYRDAIHETLFAIAAENLGHVPCVIVAPFTQERRRGGWKAELDARFQTDVKVFYLHCEDSVRHQRIVARANPRDLAKLKEWDVYSSQDTAPERPSYPHELIDTTAAAETTD
ncbi:MAG: hypothetical protein RJA70_4165 [Pseudomonadota bacterium]